MHICGFFPYSPFLTLHAGWQGTAGVGVYNDVNTMGAHQGLTGMSLSRILMV